MLIAKIPIPNIQIYNKTKVNDKKAFVRELY